VTEGGFERNPGRSFLGAPSLLGSCRAARRGQAASSSRRRSRARRSRLAMTSRARVRPVARRTLPPPDRDPTFDDGGLLAPGVNVVRNSTERRQRGRSMRAQRDDSRKARTPPSVGGRTTRAPGRCRRRRQPRPPWRLSSRRDHSRVVAAGKLQASPDAVAARGVVMIRGRHRP
jgi:hypothetical protein